MKIPYTWLKDYVKTDASPEEIAASVASIGTEVEEIIYADSSLDKVVAGRIEKLTKHPDADRLQLCQIDIGEEGLLQIVTGAENVFEGAFVPVALHGANLPNGLKIKKSKLRGEVSYGMLCSGEELLLKEADYPGAEVHGILILMEGTAKPGQPMQDVLMQGDTVIDFEVGANRADCLSIIGVAREAAAALDVETEIPNPTFSEAGGDVKDYVKVTVDAPDLCPRYMARAIKNVKIAPSPRWMQERLASAGMRPINNIVDITNFVMLEVGQPMHAFDAEDIHGNHIIVRRANEGETLVTLDGKEHTFTKRNLLITDESGAIGIAGVMGGENSEIKEDTQTVILESAKFMYANIRQTSNSLGISTESSMRYAKGIDAATPAFALARACQLVEALGAGEIVSGEIDLLAESLEQTVITVNADEINARLGTTLTRGEMVRCLNRVEIATELQGESEIICTVPRFRMDIHAYADIAEEIARIYGYDNIPESNSPVSLEALPQADPDMKKNIVRRQLSANGYYECVSFTFMGMHELDKLGVADDDMLRGAVPIMNPFGDDSAYVRTTLLPALLNIMSSNMRQKNRELRLFEVNPVFIPKELPISTQLPDERLTLAMAISPDVGGYYEIKGDVENALAAVGVKDAVFTAGGADYLHPGIRAQILVDGIEIGQIGEVHPDVAEAYELHNGVCIALIDLEMVDVSALAPAQYVAIPRFPALERDIAVVVKEEVEAGAVRAAILRSGGKYLETVELFDVYRAPALGMEHKSLAFALGFRSMEGTLTEDDVERDIANILVVLKETFGAELRQ